MRLRAAGDDEPCCRHSTAELPGVEGRATRSVRCALLTRKKAASIVRLLLERLVSPFIDEQRYRHRPRVSDSPPLTYSLEDGRALSSPTKLTAPAPAR